MDGLRKKVDDDIYRKLIAHRVTDDILWDFNEQDLIDIGITEKGPIKIILKYISNKEQHENDPLDSSILGQSEMTIRSILEKESAFQTVLHRFLDYELIPEHKDLLRMNRILTKHFFQRQIIEESNYPTWQDKQKLAENILREFPFLQTTRVSETAPPESFFFWKHGGGEAGCHTGIIETRVGNMRKDVLPENRLFRRTTPTKLSPPEGMQDLACEVAAISPTPQNARNIKDGMAQCFPLHDWILKTRKTNKLQEILTTFPHLLAYQGRLIQQAFDLLKPDRNQEIELERYLRAGTMLDKSNWINVHDRDIKGLLRIFKSLSNRGIKRTAGDEQMHPDELIASPLVRWIKLIDGDTDVDALNRHATREDLQPHIVCVGDLFRRGRYHIVCEGYIVTCGESAVDVVDVFFKMFDVLGAPVPPLLRNLHSLFSFYVFKSIDNPGSQTAQNLARRIEETM